MSPFNVLIALPLILNCGWIFAEKHPNYEPYNCNSPHVENVSIANVLNKRFYVVATTSPSDGGSCQTFEINSNDNPPKSGVILDKGTDESASYYWSSYSSGIFTYELTHGLNGYLALLYFNDETSTQSLALFTCPDKTVIDTFNNLGSAAATYPQTLLIMSTQRHISHDDIEALENQAKTAAAITHARFTAINQTDCNYN